MASAHPTQMQWRHPNLGRLVIPRDCSNVIDTHAAGIAWAADNGAFAGLDEVAFTRMLARIAEVPGCLFVTVPDIVADAGGTARLWEQWAPVVGGYDLPCAWVAQDGATPSDIPKDAAAVFVGGSTGFKLGDDAWQIVQSARRQGLWVHVGRVNTMRRLRYAQSIGADSVDGTKWSRFRDTYLPQALGFLAAGDQCSLLSEAS